MAARATTWATASGLCAEQERRFAAAVTGAAAPPEQLVAVALAYIDFAVQERPLLVSVAALAHGYAVFLLEGLLGRTDDALAVARLRVEDGVGRLLADTAAGADGVAGRRVADPAVRR